MTISPAPVISVEKVVGTGGSRSAPASTLRYSGTTGLLPARLSRGRLERPRLAVCAGLTSRCTVALREGDLRSVCALVDAGARGNLARFDWTLVSHDLPFAKGR